MNINENFKSSLKALDGPIHNFEDLRNFFDKQNEKSNFETKEIDSDNSWLFDLASDSASRPIGITAAKGTK